MTEVGDGPFAHSWRWLGSGSRSFWQGLDQVLLSRPKVPIVLWTNCDLIFCFLMRNDSFEVVNMQSLIRGMPA